MFDPLRLPRSGLELSNRLVMAPMPTFAAEPDGSLSAAEAKYYRRRAAGGLAVVVTAGCAVTTDGVSFDGQWRCDRDSLLPSLEAAARAIRSGGAEPALQLSHHGGEDIASMGEREALRLLKAFAAAADRARRAGFAAVELHGGHRYLLQQFFSAQTNERSWNWGGKTVERRLRFPRAAVEAVAERVRSVWYRMDPEEPEAAGIDIEESTALAVTLSDAGAEVFDVSARDYFAGSIRGEDSTPRARLVHAALDQRAVVMAVGRIETPDQVRRALADGPELVGLGRALLAAPDWPALVRRGETPASGVASDGTLRSAAVPEPVIAFFGSQRQAR